MEHARPAKRPKRRPVAYSMSRPVQHPAWERLTFYGSCERCHSQKIKCSGDKPCQGCRVARQEDACRYPFRDRDVTVKESDIEKLEAEIQELKAQIAAAPHPFRPPESSNVVPYEHPALANDPDVYNPLLDSSDGLFAGQQSSQPVFIGEASCTKFGHRLLECVDRRNSTAPCNTVPGHVTHPAFNRLLNPEFQLPNRIQANLLARRAENFIGNNYHLFEKVTFYRQLERAYVSEEPLDKLFACQLFAVLALGELYSNCKTTSGETRVPGTSWYIQAVSLLQDLYEIPSVEQVQVLLLLSFYANALGRLKTAHVYCGIALRLAVSLGIHRSQSGSSIMDPVQRESRRRTWWTYYLFDRLISSKLGYPLGIHDEDIDVEQPSMDGLSAAEQREFSDPVHLCAHVRLARIAGDILSDIYCLPQQKRGTFVRRVHRTLNDLQRWDEELPDSLRRPEAEGTPRSLFTLHMQYHLCIIQTTRPILLHLFKTRLHEGDKANPRGFSPTTLALADACVQAARTTNSLLSKLFVEGALAVFGYFDSHYLFSSTLILIIAAVMEPATGVSDAVQTAFSLLRSMANNGNVSAHDYLCRLEHIRRTVGTVRAEADAQPIPPSARAALDHTTPRAAPADGPGTSSHPEPPTGTWEVPDIFSAGYDINPEDPLDNPFIQSFLAESAFQGPAGPSPEQDVLRQFAYEFGDDFVAGT